MIIGKIIFWLMVFGILCLMANCIRKDNHEKFDLFSFIIYILVSALSLILLIVPACWISIIYISLFG
jgi:hypothetical protein